MSYQPENQEAADIRKQLEALLNKLEKTAKSILPKEQKEQLLNNMTKLIMLNPTFRKQINNPVPDKEFMKKLSAVLILGMSMKKPGELNDLFNKLDKLFKATFKDQTLDKVLNNLLKMNGPEFHKFMTQNKELKQLLDDFGDAIKNKLKPSPKEKSTVNNDPDDYTRGVLHMFGLASLTAGSIAIPQPVNLGTGYIPDVNPNHGNAFIDEINKLDYREGDPIGLNQDKVDNFVSELVGPPLAAILLNEFSANPTPSKEPPSPFSTKPKPQGTPKSDNT